MTILDTIPSIVSGAMGGLVFATGSMKRVSARTPDGRGGFDDTTTSVEVQGLVTNYSDRMRIAGGIPADQRKVLILAHGLATPPVPEDIITLGGRDWKIIEVTTDPAIAVYVCRAS